MALFFFMNVMLMIFNLVLFKRIDIYKIIILFLFSNIKLIGYVNIA